MVTPTSLPTYQARISLYDSLAWPAFLEQLSNSALPASPLLSWCSSGLLVFSALHSLHEASAAPILHMVVSKAQDCHSVATWSSPHRSHSKNNMARHQPTLQHIDTELRAICAIEVWALCCCR